jgi:NhaP-type Na+/H+ or K+/H+ antiporter
MAGAVAVVSLVVFVWGIFSARIGRADLSAPIVFVVVGVLLSDRMHIIEQDISQEAIKVLAEVTLVWVLFADAARVGFRELRADLGMYARLLVVGLPLTITAGVVLAMVLFDGMNFWLALLVGAALAPTDAALGAAVMTDPAVPERVRRVLNVESGLNDGIATPVVTVAIAGAVAAETVHAASTVSAAFTELAIGLGLGIVLGVGGGRAMRIARRRGWASADFTGPAALALALATYAGALAVGGNGFVAAFVAGLTFGNFAGRGAAREVLFVEQTAGLVSLLTWLMFGAVVVPTVIDYADWTAVLYAVLSLTVVRMLPVALALIGSGVSSATVGFIGWFGPRGLASIIFALIALEELPAEADRAIAVIGVTVLLSVFAHGLSAQTLASKYGARVASAHPTLDAGPERLPVRGLLHSHPAADEAPWAGSIP